MNIEIPMDALVETELNFMEMTCLIKFLDEYIDELKYQRAYEEEQLTDKQLNKMTRKINDAEKIKEKLQKIWKSHIVIK